MQGAESEGSEGGGVHSKGVIDKNGEAAAQGFRHGLSLRDIDRRKHAAERGDGKPRDREGGGSGGGRKSGGGGWNVDISTNTNTSNSSGNRNNTKTKHREFHTLRRRREDAGLLRSGATIAHRGGLFERGNTWSYPTTSAATSAERGKDTRAATAATGSSRAARRRPSSSRVPGSVSGTWASDSRGWRGSAAGTMAGGSGRRREGLVSTAQASKLIDELLEDQQELEKFLEEELAKRKALGDGEEPDQRVEVRGRSAD